MRQPKIKGGSPSNGSGEIGIARSSSHFFPQSGISKNVVRQVLSTRITEKDLDTKQRKEVICFC
jgi:hypothetical protein